MSLSRMGRWARRKPGVRPNLPGRPVRGGTNARSARVRPGRRGRGWWLLGMFLALGVAPIAIQEQWVPGAAVVVRDGAPVVHRWFEIREVTVSGHSQLTQAEVLARLGLRPGDSLVSIRTAQLEERLAAHPWIKEAAVSRVPFHTLSVHLTERRPAAVLKSETHRLLVAEDGQVLSALPEQAEQEGTGLPVLTGIDPRRLMHGDEQPRQAALAGIRLADLLGQSFSGLAEVDVSDPQNAVAYVRGLRFQFGPSPFEDTWDRYRKLEPAFRASLGGEGGEGRNEVDLRYPGKVIVRERG